MLKHSNQLPLENVALSYGVNGRASDAIATLGSILTLRRLSIECDSCSDENLKALVSISQVEKLALSRLPLTDKRIAQLQDFAYLKQLELVERRKGFDYPDNIRVKLKAALPNVEVNFVQ